MRYQTFLAFKTRICMDLTTEPYSDKWKRYQSLADKDRTVNSGILILYVMFRQV